MRLSELLGALPEDQRLRNAPRAGSDEDRSIRGITYDSRTVAPGALFVALRGSTTDGHRYIEEAVRLGAAALLVESLPAQDPSIPAVVVADTRRALAPLASCFFGDPARELDLIGITGTNGKTSTSYLVESILQSAGCGVGLSGTVETRYKGEREAARNTTPESLDIQRSLRAMRNHDVAMVVMEVSSHGLGLGRVAGCHFRVAAFTNLSQDHLDFHGDMQAYLKAKTELFRSHLAPGASAVLNIDDPAGKELLEVAQSAGARCLRVSLDSGSDAEIRLKRATSSLTGSQVEVLMPSCALDLELPLVGRFNVENLLVACGIAEALNVPPKAIHEGVRRCPQVPGRAERVDGGTPEDPCVIIDYAHTPDALEKLLASLRPLASGRLVVVFGCGGDRDVGKRPLMAAAVARYAHRVIVTSDNPRSEDPQTILAQIEKGIQELRPVDASDLCNSEGVYSLVEDRRVAIRHAVLSADPSDMVVIAGKGHEDYQIIGTQKYPFDDCLEARSALRERKTG